MLLKKISLILILVIIYFILGFALLKFFKVNLYYSVDPDAAYFGNAYSYLTIQKIGHIDHPGTPLQVLLALVLIPWKIYAAFKNLSFFEVTFNNLDDIFIVFKLTSSLLYFSGIFLILKSVHLLTKSYLAVICSLIGLLSVSYFSIWSISIAPESVLVFLTGLWLWLSSNIILRRLSIKYRWSLGIISGLAVACKLTGLPLIFSTFIFVPFLRFGEKQKSKLTIFLEESAVNIVLIGGSFLIGISPILYLYARIKKWAILLFTHSGGHGTGQEELFNSQMYFPALKELISRDKTIYFSIIIIPIILLISSRKKSNLISKRLIIPLYLSSIFTLFIFAKYPESHYQIVNYTLITFIISTFIGLIQSKYFKISSYFIFILVLLYTCFSDIKQIRHIVEPGNRYKTFIDNNYDKNLFTIWAGLPPIKQTALNFGNIFSEVYDEDLEKRNLKRMFFYLKGIRVGDFYGKDYDLNNLCWKQAFISHDKFKEFIDNLITRQGIESITDQSSGFTFLRRDSC